jgi:hypothetical protein
MRSDDGRARVTRKEKAALGALDLAWSDTTDRKDVDGIASYMADDGGTLASVESRKDQNMKSFSSNRKQLSAVPGSKLSQGERREPQRAEGTGTAAVSVAAPSFSRSLPANPEVVVKATRSRFTVDDKLKILDQADRCQHDCQLGAPLRREGLYHCNL